MADFRSQSDWKGRGLFPEKKAMGRAVKDKVVFGSIVFEDAHFERLLRLAASVSPPAPFTLARPVPALPFNPHVFTWEDHASGCCYQHVVLGG